MLFLLVTITLATQAVAQVNSTFDPNSVALSTKNQWCKGQIANCPTLCGGQSQTKDNSCTGSSLNYVCTCSNGTGPSNIAQYQGTIPNFICEAAFSQCRTTNPGSDNCETCGTLEPSNVAAATASTSSSSSTAVDQLADGTIEADPPLTSSALATSTPTLSLTSSTTTTPSSTTALKTVSENRSTASNSAAAHSTARSSLNTKATTHSSKSSSKPAAASSGLPTPTKIGIGVGIPLGFSVFASTIFLAYRFGRRKQRTEPKSKSYPTAIDDGEKRTGDGHDTWVGYVPEIHGAEIPLYSRELEGSLGQRRQELP